MAINYDSIVKRANKLIDKAMSKLHSARVHIVDDETDTSELSGLVIILNPATSTRPRISTQAKQEADSDDISEK